MALSAGLVAPASASAKTAGLAVVAAPERMEPPAAVLLAKDSVTLEQAVRRVRKQYGGRILSAETRGSGSERVHVIKVLSDNGRVHTVRINAN